MANTSTHKERLAIWGIGISVSSISNYSFDYVLYPFVIWKLGIIKGGIIMMFLSCLTCYLLLVFYDWAKKDWVGIETVKNLKHYNGSSMIGRITSWIINKGDIFAFLFLSVKYDPFYTTAYMRHGAHAYNGLSKRDWTIFLGSTVFGNVYWTIVAFTGVSFIEYIWRSFRASIVG